MKVVFIYLFSLFMIFSLDFSTILWFFGDINLVIAIASIVNFIIYKIIINKFNTNPFLLPIIVTILLYLILGTWYLLTYRCLNCLDVYFIQFFVLIPITSCLLILIYEFVGKCFYAIKNKK